MPDLDVINRNLFGMWRAPGKMLKGRQSRSAINDKICAALAGDLRACPVDLMASFRSLVRQIEAGIIDANSSGQEARRLRRSFKDVWQAGVADRALVRALQETSGRFESLETMFLREFCHAVIDYRFHGKILHRLVGPGSDDVFESQSAGLAWGQLCHLEVADSVDKMCKDIQQNRRVRKPRIDRSLRVPTSELMSLSVA